MGKDSVFNKVMSTVDDNLNRFMRDVFGFRHFSYIMEKPIGLLSKEYGFSVETLLRNMGNNLSAFDGYGTPIGAVSDPYYTIKMRPAWYYFDQKKRNTSNYLEYVSLAYNDESLVNNFIDQDFKMITYDPNELITNLDYVGAVRHYNGNTNPNSVEDTRLGTINGYYLDGTLYASSVINNGRKDIGNSITEGAYSSFGLGDGKHSMINGYSSVDGRVMTQDELIGDIIPWSTTDYTYDSNIIGGGGNGNINKVIDILTEHGGVYGNKLNTQFADEVQSTNLSSLYRSYGNFYSITYSLGLLYASGNKTKNYIAKSMYGYNLMSDKDVNFDYESGDITNHSEITGKKYYVSNGTRGTNYIDAMTSNDVDFIKYNNNVVRMKLIDAGNDNLWSTRSLFTYAEAEYSNGVYGSNSELEIVKRFNDGIEYGKHIAYNENDTSKKKDIIYYTNKLFKRGKLDTLVSRFHGDEFESKNGARINRDITQSAISKYGVSHGRNLLKRKHEGIKDNGYSNPYCRVWTYHHQYGTLNETIRPFDRVNDGFDNSEIKAYRNEFCLDKLSKYGAKTSVGLVKIAPSSKNDIRKCMFSIENLAWKGEKNFFKNHEDQKGPLGGRIMWFPPYDLRFNEDSNVEWSPNQFINRGEKIYTYVDTERSGSLNFKLLIDHPSIINSYRGDVNGGDGIGDVDDVENTEQKLLRFFAGCDILDARSIKSIKNEEKQKENKSVLPIKTKTVTIPKTVYDEINFFVFYPNNYSGEDNEATDNIRPMEYLANGIGASLICDNGKTVEFGTTLDDKYNGYEMRNVGITPKDGYKGTCGDNKLIGDNYSAQKHMGKNGKYRYWGYRVDKRVANEVLYPINGDWDYNYFDTTSYQLNSIGYDKLLQAHTNMKQAYDEGKLYSFAEVFCAMEGNKAENILNGLYDSTRSNIIKQLINDYEIMDVEVNGFASSHGYTDSNEKLNRNRAKSVLKWLCKCNNKFSMDMLDFSMNAIGDELGHHDSRDFSAKVWRCAKVCIRLQKEDVIEREINVDPPTIEISEKRIDNINHFDNVSDRSNEYAKDIANTYNVKDDDSLISIYNSIASKTMHGEFKNISKMQIQSAQNQIENNKAEFEVESMSAKTNGDTTFINEYDGEGYKNEYRFFKELERNEPFLHNKLVEKIKYFDPAFHSITPEGFNARLTFLNQCTRQGTTHANSDSNAEYKTASNLSFGRPPICVLRIGDFYNTKILITSLRITYDDTTWDLNDEGIGIMPMIADISISFKFLGGSDLSGPVSRLQNALSFNYYANTIVYDNRAEEAEYNNEGELINFKPKK